MGWEHSLLSLFKTAAACIPCRHCIGQDSLSPWPSSTHPHQCLHPFMQVLSSCTCQEHMMQTSATMLACRGLRILMQNPPPSCRCLPMLQSSWHMYEFLPATQSAQPQKPKMHIPFSGGFMSMCHRETSRPELTVLQLDKLSRLPPPISSTLVSF